MEIKPIPIGDPKNRSKLTFEVVTARVIETAGKKHVVLLYGLLKLKGCHIHVYGVSPAALQMRVVLKSGPFYIV